MTRPTIDEYFTEVAKVIATRSTCLRHQVGAILVREKMILSTGYNGAPKSTPHCDTYPEKCLRDEKEIPTGTQHEICRAAHSEQNAIAQAAYHGVGVSGATMYCTLKPCIICMKIIINSGVIRVVYEGDYGNTDSDEMAREAGVRMERLGLLL